MPKAVKVTEGNIDYIQEYAEEFGVELESLYHDLQYNADDGYETYLVHEGTPEQHNVTFTELIDIDFYSRWKFCNDEPGPTEFTDCELA
jgi:hypothetical protein